MTAGDDDPRLAQLAESDGDTTLVSWRAPDRLLRSLFVDAYPYERWPAINTTNDAIAQACQDIAQLASADERQLLDVLAALDRQTGDLPLVVLGDATVTVGDGASLADLDDLEEVAATLLDRGYSRADLEAALDRAANA